MYNKILRELFTHPKQAILYVRRFTNKKRWACVHCGCIQKPHIHHKDQRNVITYQCIHCHKTFSELYGTIFFRSKIPLHVWMKAILFWIQSTGSISAAEMSRHLDISHCSAWKMLMKIRKYMNDNMDHTISLNTTVEADEAWFGKRKKDKRTKKVIADNQDIVLGIVERHRRKLKLVSIPNVKEKTLYPIIRTYVKQGSNFYTDSRITYSITNLYYNHKTTNHSKGQFARTYKQERVHSNTIEQIWGDIKGIIRTIHHGVSKKYRKLYFAQYIFKYEHFHNTNLFYKTLSLLFQPTYCLI